MKIPIGSHIIRNFQADSEASLKRSGAALKPHHYILLVSALTLA